MNELSYHIAVANFSAFGPATHRKIREQGLTYEQIWRAKYDELLPIEVTPRTFSEFVTFRRTQQPETFLAQLDMHSITAVAYDDDRYPPLLREITDPPSLLFVQGKIPDPKWPQLAVVGSRHATTYGLEVARRLTLGLARAGVVIVSGLAYGIDERAHEAALEVGGRTTAVLASGLLAIDNTRHRRLKDKILNGDGTIMSEFPLTAPPLHYHFPIRNRIVSGMCNGTLVIEAGLPSGSLITANSAKDQNRDVFAVPGQIDSPTSTGTNHLLKDGAHLVTEARDVLEVLRVPLASLSVPRPTVPAPTSDPVIAVLGAAPLHIDEIARRTNLSTPDVSSRLTLLELSGHARHLGGMYYVSA